MARIRTSSGLNDFIRDLTSLDVAGMTTDMIKAAEPIMMEAVKSEAEKHIDTGEMARSVRSTGVKERGGGKYLVVRPTGRDNKGVRNMEKMAYLEYGTSKQAAKPIILPAVKKSEAKVEKVWNEKMGMWMRKVTMTETFHLPKMKWE